MSGTSLQVGASPGPGDLAATVRGLEDVEAPTMPSSAVTVIIVAYDARLDRRVALKLLRYRADGAGGGEEQARLVREARSMARLSHPNVVAVYDSGPLDDGSRPRTRHGGSRVLARPGGISRTSPAHLGG